jgi:hypothetical protein
MRFRAFSITGNTTLTAVYNNVCGAIPSTDSVINVSAVISPNTPATGYYATLWQNGVMLQSCFTTCSFVVSNGQSYQVAVANFGSSVFSQWTNGSTNNPYTVTIGSTTTTVYLTAVYT